MKFANRLQQVSPDDLVVVFFSTHGSLNQGEFHLYPFDVRSTSSGVDENTISGAQLGSWLRGIDAGQLILVLESCHAGGAVGETFKPGPFADHSLGQLAYDKGMRFLAAAEAKGTTIESETTEHGIMSFALLEEGLRKGRADRNTDGMITVGELLRFGETHVASLYRQALKESSNTKNASALVNSGATGSTRRSVSQTRNDQYLRVKSDRPGEPVSFTIDDEPELLDFYDTETNGADTVLKRISAPRKQNPVIHTRRRRK
jgi:hypothetical protein